MKNEGYENVSLKLARKDIDLVWLTGITGWSSSRAVAMTPHRHPHMELIFCLKGSLTYKIDDKGEVTIGASSGLVIPANTLHVLKDGTDTPCERLGLHISRPASTRHHFRVFAPADLDNFLDRLAAMSSRPFRLDSRLLPPVKELVRLLKVGRLSSSARGLLRALCCTILYYVADTLSKPLASPQPQMMDEAVRFLEAKYAKQITSDALVLKMGYGRTRLFQLFKEHTGLTPNEYLTRLRIRKAKELLVQTPKTIAAIAKETGFSSSSYFRSVFRKYEGRNPDSFREQERPR